MGDITCIIKCPICGEEDTYPMPDDLGVQAGDITYLFCAACEEQLEGYVKQVIQGGRLNGFENRNKTVMMLDVFCNEGNPHAIALCRDMLRR